MFAASKSGSAAAPTDANFNYVTMLLHGDGTNGAQNNTFLDSSTNNFTITRNGNTTQGTFSPYGSNWSNYFNGSSYINAPANAAFAFGTGSWTVEAWVFVTTLQEILVFDTRSSASTAGIGCRIDANGTLYYSGSANNSLTSSAITANTWNHVAWVYNGTTLTGYINGVNGGTATPSFNISQNNGIVGRVGFAASGYMLGYISNLRVVKGTAVYTSNFTPSITPLTAISGTSLLTCADNRFIDDSTNNFAITVSGSPSVQRFSPFNPTTAYSTSVIGGSGYFDGSGDYLSAGDQTAFEFGSGEFTISAWVYLTSFASTCTIASKYVGGDVANSEFVLWVTTGGNIGIALDGGGGEDYIASSAGAVTLNQWQYIVASKSGTTVRLFLNGTQVASGTSSRTLNSTGTALTIGGIGSGSLLTGYMSGLCIQKGIGYSSVTVPTAPITPPTNTSLLLNYTNAAIIDNAMMNDLETVGNAQISTSVKKYGTGSMYFDGTGDRLISPANPVMDLSVGDFTVECWVYTNTTSGAHSAAMRGAASGITSGSDVQWNIYQNGTSIIVRPYSSSTDYTINVGTITSGVWYHVALVRSGSTFMGFLNGIRSSTTQTISGSLNNNTAWYGVIVGLASLTTGDEAWNGYIDDLRITKGVARYTANFSVPTAAFPDKG